MTGMKKETGVDQERSLAGDDTVSIEKDPGL
jgi:hypothetical protein